MGYLMTSGKLYDVTSHDERMLMFYCPACEMVHPIHTHSPAGKPKWKWNGDDDKPTFSPSLRVIGCGKGGGDCHLFVRDGEIQYCADSWHGMAGKTVQLPKFRWSPDDPEGASPEDAF